MTNIVNFRRRQDDFKEEAIEEIRNDSNGYRFYITFPEEDEGKVFFYSNFKPGLRELYAVETVLDFIRSQMFAVEEDS